MSVLRQNSVALISLFLAIASLGYTTWRNETSEVHRNTRAAAFRALEELGALQVIVDEHLYEGARSMRVGGWARVLLVHDLATLLPPPAPAAADALSQRWQEKVDAWDSGDAAAGEAISASIKQARADLLTVLRDLR